MLFLLGFLAEGHGWFVAETSQMSQGSQISVTDMVLKHPKMMVCIAGT